MMEWEPVYRVAMLSFLIGIVFGAVVNKTNFCTMGAVSDWVNMGNKGRLRAWFLAIGIVILLTHMMQFKGIIDVREAIYLTPNFGWLGYLLGGSIFGVGMTLASGCGQRTLVRVGGGNLKSLVALLTRPTTCQMFGIDSIAMGATATQFITRTIGGLINTSTLIERALMALGKPLLIAAWNKCHVSNCMTMPQFVTLLHT